MSKYILGESIELTYNASSKARDDINFYAEKFGYKMIANNDKRNTVSKFGKIMASVRAILILLVKIRKSDTLLVQSSLKILPMITFVKKVKKNKLIYIIHDLDAVRDCYEDNKAVEKELRKLSKIDYIVAHNKYMINFLKNRGITKNNIISLDIFDYYLPNNNIKKNYQKGDTNVLVFAGNLDPSKTGFIYKLDKMNKEYNLNLYGKTDYKFNTLNYCGKSKPEDLPNKMSGDYGLVWEGDELFMDELKHPYIMLNNPHKVSLYIVSGLPVIIWRKAALADFIIDNNLGIVIDNLLELDDRLNKISYEEYALMKKNTLKMRKKLINGEHLKMALDYIEKNSEVV